MKPFVYEGLAARVVFGSGTIAQVADEAAHLGCKRVLVLTTSQQASEADRFAALLGPAYATSFKGAVMHTPVDVTEAAMIVVRDREIDGVLAIGGGSTIGLGKAIALRTDLPQIVVPTTYAGSEMTPIIGQTENGIKTTQRTPRVLPESVIYDVDLTLSLPPVMSVTSGLNPTFGAHGLRRR